MKSLKMKREGGWRTEVPNSKNMQRLCLSSPTVRELHSLFVSGFCSHLQTCVQYCLSFDCLCAYQQVEVHQYACMKSVTVLIELLHLRFGNNLLLMID